MEKTRKIRMPEEGLYKRAHLESSTFNEEDNTIDVVFSVGARGLRGFFDPFIEELSMSPEHVRLERLNKGASVLDNHKRDGIKGIIGKVENARIEDGKGIATLRLSKRDDLKGIVQDIKDRIIDNLSVSYMVHKYVDVTTRDDKFPVLRAVDWEPTEISFVDVPFDPDAKSRDLSVNMTECVVERKDEKTDTTADFTPKVDIKEAKEREQKELEQEEAERKHREIYEYKLKLNENKMKL